MAERTYVAIDLKSFYASVECAIRGLDPLKTNLVVADPTRTDKTICLAVSPSLKAYGIPGRPRLFEVVQKVKTVNEARRYQAPGGKLTGKSYRAPELAANPSLAVDYIVAPPQMAYYMKVSTEIYNIYLKYVSAEDVHVYSIDEVFIDATCYLKTYGVTPKEFTMMLIKDVFRTTGITATAGIGTNLYLCKIAMDIVAKHMPPDENGVRMAELNEYTYRETLWDHRPLTDFWRIGHGYAKKLEERGMYTMGDVARCSLGGENDMLNEETLYKLFGINAELLIDHAWGWEPTTIAEIKAYRPESNSLSSGQVLKCGYTFDKARLAAREMADALALDLVEKHVVCDQVVLTVCYDIENLSDPERAKKYRGPLEIDHYGRRVPKSVHGSFNLSCPTASSKEIVGGITALFEKLVSPDLLVRRIYVVANHVVGEHTVPSGEAPFEQLNLFTDYEALEREKAAKAEAMEKEKKMQEALIAIKHKFGKNAILKGMSYEEGATAKERNGQVGGHKA